MPDDQTASPDNGELRFQLDCCIIGVREAGKYEEFDLRFRSKVESLIEENGIIYGVRYMGRDGVHEVRAPLVIGADGRFSTLRERAGLVPIKTSPAMDILWFELPHLPE